MHGTASGLGLLMAASERSWRVERDGTATFPRRAMRITSVGYSTHGTLDVAYEIVPALSEEEAEELLPYGFVAEGRDTDGTTCIDMGGAFGPKGDATAGTVSVRISGPSSGATVDIVRAQHADLLDDAPDWRVVIEPRHPAD
jgi:hypothetical protein